jgi:general secretion pathway protein A
MYEKFYGFEEKPFTITPDPRFVYLSETHKEAFAHLKYAIREGKGFSVVTGEVGTGKTTLVHTLLRNLDGDVRTAYIFNPVLSPDDFIIYLCEDLGLSAVKECRTRGQILSLLHEFLLSCYTRNERVFLIIDEAQSLDKNLLEEVRMLTNLETSEDKLLHVILLGQPELNKTLGDPRFRALKQRITARYHLRALNLTETRGYMLHRMKRAGGKRLLSIFNEEAIKEIYKYSQGIPRLINILCDNALITGFSRDKRQIGRSIIKETIDDLEGRPVTVRWRFIYIFMILLSGWGLFYFISPAYLLEIWNDIQLFFMRLLFMF